jgi:hypothetical protein
MMPHRSSAPHTHTKAEQGSKQGEIRQDNASKKQKTQERETTTMCTIAKGNHGNNWDEMHEGSSNRREHGRSGGKQASSQRCGERDAQAGRGTEACKRSARQHAACKPTRTTPQRKLGRDENESAKRDKNAASANQMHRQSKDVHSPPPSILLLEPVEDAGQSPQMVPPPLLPPLVPLELPLPPPPLRCHRQTHTPTHNRVR